MSFKLNPVSFLVQKKKKISLQMAFSCKPVFRLTHTFD